MAVPELTLTGDESFGLQVSQTDQHLTSSSWAVTRTTARKITQFVPRLSTRMAGTRSRGGKR